MQFVSRPTADRNLPREVRVIDTTFKEVSHIILEY